MFDKVDIAKLNELDDLIDTSPVPPLSLKYKTKRFGDDNFDTSNNVLDIQNGSFVRVNS